MRVVSLRKAALAGIAGAVAWEAVLRGLILVGMPTFDVVKALGTLAFEEPAGWWPAGMTAHALVGVCWAVFYAYFFWAQVRWPPPLQGLAFGTVPALLALFIMSPQLHLMHLDARTVQLTPELVLPPLSPVEIGGLLLGHAIFGLTIGILYVRPVGYPAGRPPSLRTRPYQPTRKPPARREAPSNGFIFATGIECSYPTVEHGSWRHDEMQATAHYQLWQRDFELAREIGVTHLRYGPPLHLLFPGPDQYRWELIDEALADLRDYGPEPIVDLCHFGVPGWLGDF